MGSNNVTTEKRVSDAALTEALKRYGNNKAGDMYRLLLELRERRNGLFSFRTADGKQWEEVGAPDQL